jgi:hypothetical protein
MSLSAEETSLHVADIVFSMNWKERVKGFTDIFKQYKGSKNDLKDEILIYLYFIGDYSICAAQLGSEAVTNKMRSAFDVYWKEFANKKQPSAINNLELRIAWYENGVEKFFKQDDNVTVQPKPMGWFVAKELCKACQTESIYEVMYAAGVFTALVKSAVEFIRDVDRDEGIT